MNAPESLARLRSPPIHRIALAALAGHVPGPGDEGGGAFEAAWLRSQAEAAAGATWADWQAAPAGEDAWLAALAGELRLEPAEVLAVALAVAVEFDPVLGRVLAWVQAPAGAGRPTLGLLDSLAGTLGLADAVPAVLEGAARASGLLQLDAPARPLPELACHVPVPLALALRGIASSWPGMRFLAPGVSATPASLGAAAALQAEALRAGGGVLVVRSGHPREACMGAALVAAELGLEAACFAAEPPPGVGPWLWLRGAVPVLCAELAPGETRRLADLPGHRGPVIVAAGIDGSFEREGDPVASWRVPLPDAAERAALWRAHLGPGFAPVLADRLGRLHRHSASHIEHLGRAARRQAQLSGDAALTEEHVKRASRQGAAGELGTLAHLLTEHVPDEALVVSAELRAALVGLQQRCQRREGLAEALGPAARTRYRPGVRALLVGPSGTGKTLAAGWLASGLGLPLYRVDLASVASKYIGETEKNLAQLFARAEHAEVVLLFDEADSLFGKRTEVKDSNDRFANQQTNYLLQRIESFDGIAILTSNSRARFDTAFTRRLDTIVDFPAPGPEERRALWLAHLGAHHRLDAAQINRTAASCDLAGGHIRNATLAAACLGAGPIEFETLRRALDAEYRKLGRPLPAGL